MLARVIVGGDRYLFLPCTCHLDLLCNFFLSRFSVVEQANREDPYDVKYANYDFYRLIEDECCGRLQRINFPIFKPSSDHYEYV